MENAHPIFLGEYLLFFQFFLSKLKDSKETFLFMEKNKNRKFTIFNVHGNLKLGKNITGHYLSEGFTMLLSYFVYKIAS